MPLEGKGGEWGFFMASKGFDEDCLVKREFGGMSVMLGWVGFIRRSVYNSQVLWQKCVLLDVLFLGTSVVLQGFTPALG